MRTDKIIIHAIDKYKRKIPTISVTGDRIHKGTRMISQNTTMVTAIGHKNINTADKIQMKIPIEDTKRPATLKKAFIIKNGIAKNVTK